MNKKVLIAIGVVVGLGIMFGAYKFLTLKDFEFNKTELEKTESTITKAIQSYHSKGWEGVAPYMLPQFVEEYSAEELDKVLKFLVASNEEAAQYTFVLEEFSPPPAEENPIRVEISGVIAENGFPLSLAKFQLVRHKSDWLISGFFGENSKGIERLSTEELARSKTALFDFFDLAGRNLPEAYDSTHDKFQDETNLNDFKRILSVLSLPLTTEPKCGYYFKAASGEIEGIDQVFVLKDCGIDDYTLELTLLQSKNEIKIGGLFVK